jgi:hypothetical protein
MVVEHVVASGPDFRWLEASDGERDESSQVWYACPCCDYPTLRTRLQGELCVVCWWHDHPETTRDLSPARQNARERMISFAPEEHPELEGSHLVQELKREALALFDSIRDSTNKQDVSIVWYRAHNALENAELIRRGEADFE